MCLYQGWFGNFYLFGAWITILCHFWAVICKTGDLEGKNTGSNISELNIIEEKILEEFAKSTEGNLESKSTEGTIPAL